MVGLRQWITGSPQPAAAADHRAAPEVEPKGGGATALRVLACTCADTLASMTPATMVKHVEAPQGDRRCLTPFEKVPVRE